jgi:hypothetical protein
MHIAFKRDDELPWLPIIHSCAGLKKQIAVQQPSQHAVLLTCCRLTAAVVCLLRPRSCFLL